MITGDGSDRAGLLALFRFSRKEAEAAYREIYGISVGDPAIDKELEERMYREGRDSETVTLPTRLVMALVFRGRSATGGRPPKEKHAKYQERLLVGWASQRMDTLIGLGVPYLEAKMQAAEEVLAWARETGGAIKYAGIDSAETLAARMRRTVTRQNPETESSS